MKAFGEFICYKCGTVTKAGTILPNGKLGEQMVDKLGLTCKCGEYIQQYIPPEMREGILSLASKGYKINLINTKTVCIVFNHKLSETEFAALPELPYEFSYDMTDPDCDILLNARIQADDFEDIDKEQYIKDAYDNFTDWCRKLPTLHDGEYIDFTKNDETMFLKGTIREEDGNIDLTNGGATYAILNK